VRVNSPGGMKESHRPYKGETRGQLSPKPNEDIPQEPVSLSVAKTAFSLKHEECIREAIRRSK